MRIDKLSLVLDLEISNYWKVIKNCITTDSGLNERDRLFHFLIDPGPNIKLILCMILSRIRVTVDGGLDWMIGFIDTLYTPLELHVVTALSVFYTLYNAPLHKH
jgi:hypothetical protein